MRVNKWVGTFVIVIITLFLGYVLGLFESNILQKNWVSYTHEKYGVTLKVPREYTIQELESGYVYIGKRILLTQNDFIGSDYGDSFMLGENKGYREKEMIGAKGGNIPQEVLRYWYIKDDKKVQFTLYSVDHDQQNDQYTDHLKRKDIREFTEILSTLKFKE
jgi:hypothetical protein